MGLAPLSLPGKPGERVKPGKPDIQETQYGRDGARPSPCGCASLREATPTSCSLLSLRGVTEFRRRKGKKATTQTTERQLAGGRRATARRFPSGSRLRTAQIQVVLDVVPVVSRSLPCLEASRASVSSREPDIQETQCGRDGARPSPYGCVRQATCDMHGNIPSFSTRAYRFSASQLLSLSASQLA